MKNNEKIDQTNQAIQEFEIALANKRAELKSLLQTGESLKNSCQLAFDQHETLRRSLDARCGQIQQWCDDLKQAKDKQKEYCTQWKNLKNLDLDHL